MPYKLLILLYAVLCSSYTTAEISLLGSKSGIFQRPDIQLNEDERYISRSAETIYETKQIPAKLGTKFGISYQVSGKEATEENNVSYLYITPGVVHPDGTRNDIFIENINLQKDTKTHIAAFEFTDQYELVEGTWEIFVFVDNRILVRKKFNVSSGVQPATNNQDNSDLLQYRVISPAN
jgi:hypothetical protein